MNNRVKKNIAGTGKIIPADIPDITYEGG